MGRQRPSLAAASRSSRCHKKRLSPDRMRLDNWDGLLPTRKMRQSTLSVSLNDIGESRCPAHSGPLSDADTACTLTSTNNLAMVLRNQGKYEQAEEMHRQVLGPSETLLGVVNRPRFGGKMIWNHGGKLLPDVYKYRLAT